MRPAQWIAALLYIALVVVTWVSAGVVAAVVLLICALFLLVVFRLNQAGEAIVEFARRYVLRRPPSRRARDRK